MQKEVDGVMEAHNDTETYMEATPSTTASITAQESRSSSPLTPAYSPMSESYVPLTYPEAHALRVGMWENNSDKGSGKSGGSGGEGSVFRALAALSDVTALSGNSRPPSPDFTLLSADDTAYRIPPKDWKRRDAVKEGEAVVCSEETTAQGTRQVADTVSARERAAALLVYRAHQQYEQRQQAAAETKEGGEAVSAPSEPPHTAVPERESSLLRRFEAGELPLEDAPPAPSSTATPACLSAEGTKGHKGDELCVGWAAADAAEGACAGCLARALKLSRAHMLPTRVHDEIGEGFTRYENDEVNADHANQGWRMYTVGRHTQAATSVLHSMRNMLDRLYTERQASRLPTTHLVKALEQSHKSLVSVLEVAEAASTGEDFQDLPMYQGMGQHMYTYDEKVEFLNQCDQRERARQQGIMWYNEYESAKESDAEQGSSCARKRKSGSKRTRSNVPKAILFSDTSEESESGTDAGGATKRARRSASRD